MVHRHLFVLLFLSATSTANATRQEKPHALIQTVIKDPITNLYFTSMDIGTNFTVSVSLVIDLSQPYTWFDCFSGYSSASYTSIDFDSPKCKLPKFTNPHNLPKPGQIFTNSEVQKQSKLCNI